MNSHKNRGYRNNSNWRYRVMKQYKHRAQTFLERSKTNEEKEAWKKVIQWLDTILNRRYLTPTGAIGIPKSNIELIK